MSKIASLTADELRTEAAPVQDPVNGDVHRLGAIAMGAVRAFV